MSTVKIKVNGQEYNVEQGTTILKALRELGIRVPTLCYLEGLTPAAACRICIVEVEGRADLVPSCAFEVQEGMSILTHSARVRSARKTIVELLLANHPDECLYCERNLNCDLQTLANELGVRKKRFTGTQKRVQG
jgi:NADH dehydrogenase/NADH:ubiquinone oxidoreductase subunit G